MHHPFLFKIISLFLAVSLCNGIAFNCTDDADCSYNGVCDVHSHVCFCQEGWLGEYCQQLALLPANNHSGLNLFHNVNPTSTWGGSVLYSEEDGLYHMWVSELSNSCGIHQWLGQSIISHAVSVGPPNWQFSKISTVWPIFSHEPVVVRAPASGEYVMFFTHQPSGPASDVRCHCTNGNSYSGGAHCEHEPMPSANATLYTYFSFSESPYGPWSDPISLAGPQIRSNISARIDMNLSPVIQHDGSLIAWTRWDIWQASDWRNASTYRNTGQAPDWNHGGQWEGEDPHLWMDSKGYFHILSHNGKRGDEGNEGDCGRHLYSETGLAGTWRAAPLPLGGCAYARAHVTWQNDDDENGSSKSLSQRTFYRRERPHLIFGPDGTTPIALSTSVIDSPSVESQTPQRDASYTLIQAIGSYAATA